MPISHDLLHPHSQLLGFQAYPLSDTPLLINSLHSHLHSFLLQRCLLLQTIASNLHIHLHVLCHFIFFVSLVLDIRLNTFAFKSFTTSGTHIFAYGSLILLQLPLHLLALILNYLFKIITILFFFIKYIWMLTISSTSVES